MATNELNVMKHHRIVPYPTQNVYHHHHHHQKQKSITVNHDQSNPQPQEMMRQENLKSNESCMSGLRVYHSLILSRCLLLSFYLPLAGDDTSSGHVNPQTSI